MPVTFDARESPGVGYAPLSPARIRWEILIVLMLSLGASAIYAILSIAHRLTREESLSEQTASLNQSLSDSPLFDLFYQVTGIFIGLAPVALVIFLLWQENKPHCARLGLAGRPRWSDAWGGLLLAAVIGVPGIALYLGARSLNLNVTVIPAPLDTFWWTIPVLVLAALKAALLEEIIVVGYLFARLRDLTWRPWSIILTSAILRGSYHLYQGFGGFVGNVAMGIVFGVCYQRYGRTRPLIVAHWILDIVSFVGYAWAISLFPDLFGV
ncbi:CPBP family intramembrane glutamic endopeptidase [Lysinibacter sp. HNR]|uniref:CPBP family intramembrane glutamic endopeptidase n=1 Tax=Lysinibacter sp. HNR TaxID=3031408 RepID=UPI00243596DA|nr:CPBP family intramembrane glutamic endopeptidase [Lysinibacter sp. HNR]WGD38353.1 CPBP family intramembrane metalloprotease [Lysinibacter sp. HNR]